jgi:hypothetical protein
LKEEALNHTMWRNRFGRDAGSVVRQITERMNFVASDKKEEAIFVSVTLQPKSGLDRFVEVPTHTHTHTHARTRERARGRTPLNEWRAVAEAGT